jgi:predicted esterase
MTLKKEILRTSKTARYFMMGEPGPEISEVWFVCHGYGQLAVDFLPAFTILDDGRHLLVAPEGLNRFYLNGTGGRIGASWMTREDRQDEIADYIAYLDEMYRAVMNRLPVPGDTLKTTVLGFSQGTATASRWVFQGSSPAQRLILWGGDVPPDIPWETCRQRLVNLDIQLVAGDKDPLMGPSRLQKQVQLLEEQGACFQTKIYDGFHLIDPAVLEELAN